jgi:hypothetical protein
VQTLLEGRLVGNGAHGRWVSGEGLCVRGDGRALSMVGAGGDAGQRYGILSCQGGKPLRRTKAEPRQTAPVMTKDVRNEPKSAKSMQVQPIRLQWASV